MSNQQIKQLQQIFMSRLKTLSHLLDTAEKHFGAEAEAVLEQRIASDMFPFGTQVAFVCNQPLSFAQWCAGQPIENLDKEVKSLAQARGYVASTLAKLEAIVVGDEKLDEIKRVQLGPVMYLDLPGRDYVSEFLMPNFYFHLTTAYNILRMAGAPIGKADYMTHIGHLVKQA